VSGRGGGALGAALRERRLLAGDGAMGTALQEAGLAPGGCPEAWNLERPGDVAAVLRAYRDAGADLLQTNSFGGHPARLAAHGLADRCTEINRAAAGIARDASAGSSALVAGSIGPTGQLLRPLGTLDPADARDGFMIQAAALAGGGCDILIVETMTDLEEALLAVEAAAATGLDVIACMTFEITPRGVFTVFGASPGGAAGRLEAAGARALGTNCGTGPGDMIPMVSALRAATALPILAQPNAGLPEVDAGRLRYPESPEAMAARVPPLVEAGASIIGGCCGTTADHVRAIAAAVRRESGATPDR